MDDAVQVQKVPGNQKWQAKQITLEEGRPHSITNLAPYVEPIGLKIDILEKLRLDSGDNIWSFNETVY